ncbi:unnamed protein product, partial [Ectocarpus sp. 6 AP-2014]
SVAQNTRQHVNEASGTRLDRSPRVTFSTLQTERVPRNVFQGILSVCGYQFHKHGSYICSVRLCGGQQEKSTAVALCGLVSSFHPFGDLRNTSSSTSDTT